MVRSATRAAFFRSLSASSERRSAPTRRPPSINSRCRLSAATEPTRASRLPTAATSSWSYSTTERRAIRRTTSSWVASWISSGRWTIAARSRLRSRSSRTDASALRNIFRCSIPFPAPATTRPSTSTGRSMPFSRSWIRMATPTRTTVEIGSHIRFDDDGPDVDVNDEISGAERTALNLAFDESVQPDFGDDDTYDRANAAGSRRQQRRRR